MIKLVRDGYDVQKRLSVKVVQSAIEIGLVVVSSGGLIYVCVARVYNTIQQSDRGLSSIQTRPSRAWPQERERHFFFQETRRANCKGA